MTTALELGTTFALGAISGWAFFAGLWFTVEGLGTSSRPVLRVVGSLALRFALAFLLFYLLARHAGWQHVLTAAVGFSVMRLLLSRHAASRAVDGECHR
jgi:F1F0 ATPase subunit 2